jgi:hypothetical protein
MFCRRTHLVDRRNLEHNIVDVPILCSDVPTKSPPPRALAVEGVDAAVIHLAVMYAVVQGSRTWMPTTNRRALLPHT